MINPFDYLYYKIYKALSFISGGINPTNLTAAFGLLLLSNTLTVYMLIAGEFSLTFAYCSLAVLALISLFNLLSNKEEKIIAKFKNESEKARILGDALVILYVVISIILFIIAIKYVM